ncbi:ABC transporter substrate-binding protein [Sporosarcina sp. YIM B06819]|uniref:ABC transporter substrate-binding protein n=1 Tax=Sporosarcina sp. YIM B06819 TaxID=3081769 RepID=UPI00298D23F9|nr:ABC transporter substrate-binding protein [Sporosarcina sp. YIM B06819]
MRKMTSRSFALIVMLVLSMILVACSSSDSDNDTTQENRKKILTYGHSGSASSLDPAHMKEGDSFVVIANMYETLVNLGEQDTTVVPGLAEKWESTDDGLTYTFKLRQDVKFHDETDFNADAVVSNFERWSNGNAEDFFYYGLVFDGFKKDGGSVIKSVKADGDDTVIIELNYPQESFLKNLTMNPFSMVSPTSLEQAEIDTENIPVGTGPFKFGEGKLNETITLVKFEGYWQEELPKLNKIVFKSIPNNIARLNALIAKDIDLADSINPADRLEIANDEDLQFFERPFVENIYENVSSIPNVNSLPLLGATKELLGFVPRLTGFDVLSKVQFELQLEED